MCAEHGFRRPTGRYTQARRLVELYDRLHLGGTLHAGGLAEEFGLSRRTIERDLAVLREVLGPRLTYEERGQPGWRLRGRVPRWSATRWQVLAVAVGVRMVGFLSGRRFRTDVGPLLDRLRSALPGIQGHRVRTLEKKIHVVERGYKPYRDDPALQERLTVLLDGLLRDRPVDLTYLSSERRRRGDGPRTLRVHVLCLVLHRGAVYFIVDLLSAGAARGPRRLLALDRIHAADLDAAAAPLSPPGDLDPGAFFAGAFGIWTGDAEHPVEVDIAPDYAMFVRERRWHPTQTVEARPDGSIRLRMRLSDLHEVTEWILGMGEHARAVGPPALVRAVRERLARALAQYE